MVGNNLKFGQEEQDPVRVAGTTAVALRLTLVVEAAEVQRTSACLRLVWPLPAAVEVLLTTAISTSQLVRRAAETAAIQQERTLQLVAATVSPREALLPQAECERARSAPLQARLAVPVRAATAAAPRAAVTVAAEAVAITVALEGMPQAEGVDLAGLSILPLRKVPGAATGRQRSSSFTLQHVLPHVPPHLPRASSQPQRRP